MPDSYQEIPNASDEELKGALAEIDGRLLQLSLCNEAPDFVEKMLRTMSPVMANMFKDDLEYEQAQGHDEAKINDAKTKVLGLYKNYLNKQA